MSSTGKSTQSCENQKDVKRKSFPSVALSENIHNLVHTAITIIASDQQIGSRAIETFQDGPFGRVIEAGLYKLFILSAFA